MRETYSKNYFEKYAALTLCHFFKIREEDIIQSDRPDLRIPSIQYGIEVTQALTPEEAIEDMKKPLYMSLDLTPFDHNHQDLSFVYEKIDDAIDRKLKKSKNYERYLHNGLYIFSHCHNLTENHLKLFLVEKHIPFDFYQYIFINSVTHIYCFDIASQQMTCFSLNHQELITMNLKALIFEKTCSKQRRKIILSKESL